MGIAQWVECPTKKPGVILAWDRVPGAAKDSKFSPRQLPVQALLRWPHSPCERSHASSFVRMLKPQMLTAILLSGHKNTTHADRNG